MLINNNKSETAQIMFTDLTWMFISSQDSNGQFKIFGTSLTSPVFVHLKVASLQVADDMGFMLASVNHHNNTKPR